MPVQQFSVLVYQQCGGYIARCLQRDLVAQGRTVAESLQNLNAMIIGQVVLDLEDGVSPPLSRLPAAPAAIFQQYAAATVDVHSRTAPVSATPIPPAWMIPEFDSRVA